VGDRRHTAERRSRADLDLIQLGMAFDDRINGGSNEELGGALGDVAGGAAAAWGTAIALGSFTGPWTTAALTVAAAIFVGGPGGRYIGSNIGKTFD
jgi:hypothetical protein